MVPASAPSKPTHTRKSRSAHVLSAAALAGALLITPLATAAAAPGTMAAASSQQAAFTAAVPAGDPVIEKGAPGELFVNFREVGFNMGTSYQWMSGGRLIPGATGVYYTPSAADLARGLSVDILGERYSNGIDAPDVGKWTVTIPAGGSVAGQSAVGRITLAAITARPTLSGTAGMGRTVTVDRQGWAGYSLSYEWVCDGHGVGGEGASYMMAEQCATVSVTVRATSAYGSDQVRLAAEMASTVKNTSAPTVTGKRMVGQTLTAHSGIWSAGAVLTYQWTRADADVPGATGSTYKQTAADANTVIGVKVTGTHGTDVPLTVAPNSGVSEATQALPVPLEKPPAPPKGDNLFLDNGAVNGGIQPPPAPVSEKPAVKQVVQPGVKEPAAKPHAGEKSSAEKAAVLADRVEPVITTSDLPPVEKDKPQPQAAGSLAPAAGVLGSLAGLLAALATGLARLRKQ